MLPTVWQALALAILVVPLVGATSVAALPTALLGLDVGSSQGNSIDWGLVRAAGYSFVFVKATAGNAASPQLWNHSFENQVAGATSAGLMVGVYHYAYPQLHTPEEEAEYFLSKAGAYVRKGYLRPALDIEEGEGLTLTGISLSTWIKRWIDAVHAATGVEAVVYTSASYASAHLEPWLADPTVGYDLWIAHWDVSRGCDASAPPNCGVWGDEWTFWQYWAPTEPSITGCGHNYVPGIGSDVDVDLFNGGVRDLEGCVIAEESTEEAYALVGSIRFCIEQGSFDYCSRFQWGYSGQWLLNGAPSEILLADARKAGTSEQLGATDFDRIEIRLRTWACYGSASAALTVDNIEITINSTSRVLTLDNMEWDVVERWTKWMHSLGSTVRGGSMRAVVSSTNGTQALQISVPTGIDASCAGVWAVRVFDLPLAVSTADVTLRLLPYAEGQGDYHEGFVEIFLYKRP